MTKQYTRHQLNLIQLKNHINGTILYNYIILLIYLSTVWIFDNGALLMYNIFVEKNPILIDFGHEYISFVKEQNLYLYTNYRTL